MPTRFSVALRKEKAEKIYAEYFELASPNKTPTCVLIKSALRRLHGATFNAYLEGP